MDQATDKKIYKNCVTRYVVPCSVSFKIKWQAKTTGPKIVSEYDQEIPQSQTADNPVAPRGRAAQPSQDKRKTN